MTSPAEKTYWRVKALGDLTPCPFCGSAAVVMVSSVMRKRHICCSAGSKCPIELRTAWFAKAQQADYEHRWSTRMGAQGAIVDDNNIPRRELVGCLHAHKRTESDGASLCTDCGEILDKGAAP